MLKSSIMSFREPLKKLEPFFKLAKPNPIVSAPVNKIIPSQFVINCTLGQYDASLCNSSQNPLTPIQIKNEETLLLKIVKEAIEASNTQKSENIPPNSDLRQDQKEKSNSEQQKALATESTAEDKNNFSKRKVMTASLKSILENETAKKSNIVTAANLLSTQSSEESNFFSIEKKNSELLKNRIDRLEQQVVEISGKNKEMSDSLLDIKNTLKDMDDHSTKISCEQVDLLKKLVSETTNLVQQMITSRTSNVNKLGEILNVEKELQQLQQNLLTVEEKVKDSQEVQSQAANSKLSKLMNMLGFLLALLPVVFSIYQIKQDKVKTEQKKCETRKQLEHKIKQLKIESNEVMMKQLLEKQEIGRLEESYNNLGLFSRNAKETLQHKIANKQKVVKEYDHKLKSIHSMVKIEENELQHLDEEQKISNDFQDMLMAMP